MTTTATPTKLRSGAWGAKVAGSVRPGEVVTITTRSGKSWQARVSKVVWSGDGVTIVATQSLDRAPAAVPATGRATRRTGCACGSREDAFGDIIPSPRNCQGCQFDAVDM